MKFSDVIIATASLALITRSLYVVLAVAFVPLNSNMTSDLLAFIIAILVSSLIVGYVFARAVIKTHNGLYGTSISMSIELKAIFPILLMIGLPILSSSEVFADSDDSPNPPEDQTLYFQSTRAHIFIFWLMNTSLPIGQGMSPNQSLFYFSSPPLAHEFTFQTITVKIYHDTVPVDRGEFTLNITLGFLDTSGIEFHPLKRGTTTLEPGSEVNSISVKFDYKVLEGEYLCLRIFIANTMSVPLNMRWGNSTYPSQISYEGNAVYVPEFPFFLILPLFMAATLLAVMIIRRKYRANLRVPV